jgi:hypothetical protein
VAPRGGRVIGFGASFVAVVIAVGQGFLWLQHQVSAKVLLAAAIMFIFVAIVAAVLVNKHELPVHPTERKTVRRSARLAALVVAVARAIIATTGSGFFPHK